MAQILDPIPQDNKQGMLCCYVNATSHIQVARITNIPNWYFERVVFPGQRLVFEALTGALVEIHSGMMASCILSDTIPCDRLAIDDGDDEDLDPESTVAAATATTTAQSLVTADTVQPQAIARTDYPQEANALPLRPVLV